jgi:quercetin dioxygenase-like cupin family protein
MYMATRLILPIVVLLFGWQDALTVNPKIVSVAFENDRIRVLRVHFNAHDRLDMHSHPALLVVALKPNSRRVFFPDGKQQDMSSKSGDVVWREPVTHAVENLGDSFENIEIEFKNAPAPAVSVPVSDERKDALPSGDEILPEQEPHHKLLYENQYTRVVEVQLPPGETQGFHKHSHDNLSVRLSGGLVQYQLKGEDWGPAKEVVPGAVVLSKGSTKPYIHRIKNTGTVTYHVIDVELLP